MADFIYLNRDTRFFVQLGANLWEVPILADYGFTQATESSEVTLSEAEDSSGDSVRGRATFNDALNPAEWNVNAYLRPYRTDVNDDEEGASGDFTGMVDQVLWAALVGCDKYDASARTFGRGTTNSADLAVQQQGNAANNRSLLIDWSQSNKSQQPEGLTLYFVLGQNDIDAKRIIRIERASVNEASITFDLEGIATVAWSGFGAEMEDVTSSISKIGDTVTALATTDVVYQADGGLSNVSTAISSSTTLSTSNTNAAISLGSDDTTNMIANRLSQLIIKPDKMAAGQSNAERTAEGERNLSTEYVMALTGGTITLNNNVTFLTPEELGTVNKPLRNVTGARNISGDFTCYLRGSDTTVNRSIDFWNDLASLTSVTRNQFAITFNVGGSGSETNPSSNVPEVLPSAPGVQFHFPQANIEIPAYTVEDVISLSTTFNALPSSLTETDEVFITANGKIEKGLGS